MSGAVGYDVNPTDSLLYVDDIVQDWSKSSSLMFGRDRLFTLIRK